MEHADKLRNNKIDNADTFSFSYNPWVCLFASALCVGIMFWMSYMYAAITIGVLVILGLYVFWANPETNWGSSTQGQVFVSALKHVKEVTGIVINTEVFRH